MDPRPDPPGWLPADRVPDPAPVALPPADPAGEPTAPPSARDPGPARWRRLVRSPRGAAAVALLAAALLLWPFAGWTAVPWLIGLAVLVVLRLLRLDGLLRGWALHVGGLAVVAGLMYSTTPWAWALAASIGVLLAGLVRLPRWKVAAVGAMLCLVAGAGFGLSQYRTAQQQAEADAQTNRESQGQQGAIRPHGVLPVLLNRIAQNVPGPICDNLLSPAARDAFVAAVRQADCPAAVATLASQVVDRTRYSAGQARTSPAGDGLRVDACALTWPSGVAAGPPVGVLTVGRKPGGSTYIVTALTPCSP